MPNTTLSENLSYLMRINGNLSTSELARLTEIPQPTIHHMLNGFTKMPRKQALEKLAHYFRISSQQLIGNEPISVHIPEMVKEDLKIKTIPIVDFELLKKWPIEHIKNLHLPELLLNTEIGLHSFAFEVKDKTLEPEFPQNALLIFDSGKPPKDHDVIILCKEEKIHLNRLFIYGNESFLKETMENGNIELIRICPQKDRILGSLIEVRIQY